MPPRSVMSQTLTLRAAFTSSTYLLSQIPGPACLNPPNPLFKWAHQASVRTRTQGHRFAVLRPASEDALFNPPIPLSKGAIRACGLSIAAWPSLPASSGPASDDALLHLRYLIPPSPFPRGRSGPAGFPSPHGRHCPPAPARHLMMPCYTFGHASSFCHVPNPDAPRGLYVLHVFALANTRTRLSQSP